MKECVVKPNERLKESRRGLNKAKIKLYCCKINGRSFYTKKSWMDYLEECMRLND